MIPCRPCRCLSFPVFFPYSQHAESLYFLVHVRDLTLFRATGKMGIPRTELFACWTRWSIPCSMTCHKDSKTAEDGAPSPSPLGVAETGLCFASGTATPDWWRMEKSKLLDKKAVESEFWIASAAHDLIIFGTFWYWFADVTLEVQASHNHTHPFTSRGAVETRKGNGGGDEADWSQGGALCLPFVDSPYMKTAIRSISKLEISTYVTHHMRCGKVMEVWMQVMFFDVFWLEGLEERREEAEGIAGSGEEEGRYESRFATSQGSKVDLDQGRLGALSQFEMWLMHAALWRFKRPLKRESGRRGVAIGNW